MTTEEIQLLINQTITETVDKVRAELTEQITKTNQGLASSLTKEMKKLATPVDVEESSEKLTLKSLQSQVEQLNKQLVDKENQAFNARKSQAIVQAVSSTKNLNPSAVTKLFTLEYGDSIKEENNKWFVVSGESTLSLEDALNSYLATDEGKGLVPPSNVNGSGAIETNTTINTTDKLTAADALFSAFS
jgi:hypothetical protein